MATKKAGGTAKNLTDSNAQYLGVKLFAGQPVRPGDIIVRQRGTRMIPGVGVGMGKDHTLYAVIPGIISFKNIRKTRFDGRTTKKPLVQVIKK